MKSLTLTEEKLSKDEECRSSVEMKPSHDKIILLKKPISHCIVLNFVIVSKVVVELTDCRRFSCLLHKYRIQLQHNKHANS